MLCCAVQGNQADLVVAARMIINDLQRGKVPYFFPPPGHGEGKGDEAGSGEGGGEQGEQEEEEEEVLRELATLNEAAVEDFTAGKGEVKPDSGDSTAEQPAKRQRVDRSGKATQETPESEGDSDSDSSGPGAVLSHDAHDNEDDLPLFLAPSVRRKLKARGVTSATLDSDDEAAVATPAPQKKSRAARRKEKKLKAKAAAAQAQQQEEGTAAIVSTGTEETPEEEEDGGIGFQDLDTFE